MKKVLVLWLFVFATCLHADINFTQLKGVYTVFRTKNYLSPIHGFAWWSGGQIEKLYRCGNQDHAVITLVRSLFYLNDADGLTFGPTILPMNIGAHLTPAAIGTILTVCDKYIQNKLLDPSQEQHLEKGLEEALKKELAFEKIVSDLKTKQHELTVQSEPVIQELHEKMAAAKKEQDSLEQKVAQLDGVIQTYNSEIAILTKQNKNLRKKKEENALLQENEMRIKEMQEKLSQTQESRKKIAAALQAIQLTIKNSINAERELKNKIKNAAISEYALHNFVQLLVRAFEETLPGTARYMPFTVHNILLAMLYKKVHAKKDFIQYFSSLDSALFHDASFLRDNTPAQRSWLDEQYPAKLYQTAHTLMNEIAQGQTDDQKRALLENNFEKLVIILYSYQIFTSAFPPQVLSGWARYEAYEFPDCGSSSLRNVLNALIYILNSGILDVSRLTNTFKVNDRVTLFYKNHGKIEEILDTKTRNAWIRVTSGLPSQKIDYKTPPENGVCEIAARSGIPNMNAVVQQLLGIETIDEFQKLPYVMVSKQLGSDPKFGVYTFTINNRYVFKWYFEPKHLFVSIDPAYISTDKGITQFMKMIESLLQNGNTFSIQEANNDLINLIGLYRDRLSLLASVINQVAALSMPESYRVQIMLALFDTSSITQKLQCVKAVLDNALLRTVPAAIAAVKQIIWEITDDVKQLYASLLEIILASSVIADKSYVYYDYFDKVVRDGMNILKDSHPDQLAGIVDTILEKRRDAYYGILKKKVPFSTAQLIKIVELQAKPLYGNVREYIQRIKKPLSQENEKLIQAIYKNGVQELYEPVEKRLDAETLKIFLMEKEHNARL